MSDDSNIFRMSDTVGVWEIRLFCLREQDSLSISWRDTTLPEHPLAHYHSLYARAYIETDMVSPSIHVLDRRMPNETFAPAGVWMRKVSKLPCRPLQESLHALADRLSKEAGFEPLQDINLVLGVSSAFLKDLIVHPLPWLEI